MQIFVAAVTGVIGVFCVACFVIGYFYGPLGWGLRLVLFGAGVSLLLHGVLTDLVGGLVLAAMVLWLKRGRPDNPVNAS